MAATTVGYTPMPAALREPLAEEAQQAALATLTEVFKSSPLASRGFAMMVAALQLYAVAQDAAMTGLAAAVGDSEARMNTLRMLCDVAAHRAGKQFVLSDFHGQLRGPVAKLVAEYQTYLDGAVDKYVQSQPVPLGVALQTADSEGLDRSHACVLGGSPGLIRYVLECAAAVSCRQPTPQSPDPYGVVRLCADDQPAPKYPLLKCVRRRDWAPLRRSSQFSQLLTALRRAPHHLARVDLLLVDDAQLFSGDYVQAFRRLAAFCAERKIALLAGLPSTTLALAGELAFPAAWQSAGVVTRTLRYDIDPERPDEVVVTVSPLLPSFNVPAYVVTQS